MNLEEALVDFTDYIGDYMLNDGEWVDRRYGCPHTEMPVKDRLSLIKDWLDERGELFQ